jgi:hydroxymethylglutaryl-CoA lyase
METIKIIECPRDAMQGMKDIVPTSKKIDYINSLLDVGFDTIDVGSFVHPKIVPQMADTPEVLHSINLENSKSKLLTIVANLRGAKNAANFEQVTYLGYPFSISETFQLRNTNATIEKSLGLLHDIQNICLAQNKTLVIYLSMGFGNPYGDDWSPNMVADWTFKLRETLGVEIISLSDTVGIADALTITQVMDAITPHVHDFEIGAHLHAKPGDWLDKVEATITAGCYRLDGAIKGFGGCPFAKDDLTGNLPTEEIVDWFHDNNYSTNLNIEALQKAILQSQNIF